MKPQPIFEPWRAFWCAFLATVAFALTCRYPGYVHHDTAEIAMWSGLGWPLGLPKHPPFLPWLFRTYSYVVALNWVSLAVLTGGNIVLGAWAVWRVALLILDERRATLAVLLYGLAPAGTFFALKLNHNAILVSLWPLTILAFLACLRAETAARSIAYGVAFGVLAAAGMLAKYYTGVLLASCFAASLVSARRNRFYTMTGGYVAVAVFAALVAPHALWMFDNQGATLSYALHETEREDYPLAHFLLVGPAYLLPVLAAFWALRRWRAPAPQGWDWEKNELWVLAAGPFVLTAVFIAAFKLRGATSWSLPDFSVLPVLLASMLAAPDDRELARLKRWAAAGLAVVALAGPIVLIATFALKDGNAVEPRAETVAAAGRIFAAATGKQAQLVASEPKLANAAALDIPSHPLAFTNFSIAFAPWASPERLARDGLLVICKSGDGACRGQAREVTPGAARFGCELSLHRRWLGQTGALYVAHAAVLSGEGGVLNAEAAAAACLLEGGRVEKP